MNHIYNQNLLETEKCDKAFMLTNSIDNAWWKNDDVTPMFDGDGCRSTSVGARVYVVQKTKKTPGTVRKINQTRAIVTMMGRDYNVPFSMLEAA